MEMKALVKTRKIGGSLVVTLPANIIKDKQIGENELIEIEFKKPQKSYFGALKGIGSFTEEDRAKGQFEK